MLGLVALEHRLHPQSTLDKFLFLVENALTHAHLTTTFVSFSALLVLVFSRSFKSMFKNYWWIYRLPEVFVVVVVSTSASFSHICWTVLHLPFFLLQFSPINSTGTKMASTFLDRSQLTQAVPSLHSHSVHHTWRTSAERPPLPCTYRVPRNIPCLITFKP
jgi:hypothetical protein